MRNYELPWGEFFMSEECLRESQERRKREMREDPQVRVSLNPEDIGKEWADRFIKNLHLGTLEQMIYVQAYAQAHKLNGIAVLNAHGCLGKIKRFNKDKVEDVWAYQDKGSYEDIQDWVNEVDGNFAALAVFACYPDHNFNLKTEKSLLIVPDREIYIFEPEGHAAISEVVYSLFDPSLEIPEVPSYAYEYEIGKLEEQLKKDV